VRLALEEGLGEDVRVTVLGHVQRGGAPSAFDRYMSTVLGAVAVQDVLRSTADDPPQIVGLKNNRIVRAPLVESVAATRAIASAAAAGNYDEVLQRRGGSFRESLIRQRVLNHVFPGASRPSAAPRTIAVLHGGGLAPGMNATARAVVRFALDRNHRVLGVQDGMTGLVAGDLRELTWISVNGWGTTGGAELGTARRDLDEADVAAIAATIERERIDTLVMIGGYSGYQACWQLLEARDRYPALAVTMVAIPATIDNDLPGTDITIGSDSALNSIVEAIDKIKQSAVASSRCFVVEVMGGRCGYLALAAGLATGAERVFLPEEGITLADLQAELAHMQAAFSQGKRVELIIRNEFANPVYTTEFMAQLLEEEGGPEFSVRWATLGHIQVGGAPSPFDRILAARLAAHCVQHLERHPLSPPGAHFLGVEEGRVGFTDFAEFPRLVDPVNRRSINQWWLPVRPLADALAHEPAAGGLTNGGR
jgi:6-phosphofructokinase 1